MHQGRNKTMAKMVSIEEKPNWLNLPVDLLEVIVKKLDIEDMARFSTVCLSWNRSAKSYMSSLIPPVLTCSPSIGEEQHPTGRYCFLSRRDNTIYELKKAFGRFSDPFCVGLSRGWFVILDGKYNKDTGKMMCDIYLVNPFSGVELELPSSWTLQTHKRVNCREDVIGKAILTSNPNVNNNFMVVVTHGIRGRLSVCKPGHKQWTRFTPFDWQHEHYYYEDIMYQDEKLYALKRGLLLGAIEVWKFQDRDGDVDYNYGIPHVKLFTIDCSKTLQEWLTSSDPCTLNFPIFKVRCYLVKSFLGEILLVFRLLRKLDDIIRSGFVTGRFAVCKLDSTSNTLVSIRSNKDIPKLLAEYKPFQPKVLGGRGYCLESKTYDSSYNNSDDYLTQSLVLLDGATTRLYWW